MHVCIYYTCTGTNTPFTPYRDGDDHDDFRPWSTTSNRTYTANTYMYIYIFI